jgi:hypothetical protein
MCKFNTENFTESSWWPEAGLALTSAIGTYCLAAVGHVVPSAYILHTLGSTLIHGSILHFIPLFCALVLKRANIIALMGLVSHGNTLNGKKGLKLRTCARHQ